MKTWKLALLAVAITIAALGVAAYAQQTVYVSGSYVVLLPNTTMSPLLEWLLNQPNAPVPQSGILIPVSDLPNVTIVTGYSTWWWYMNVNYMYITANWVTSNLPSGTTATYTPSNATLKFTVPSGVTATNAEVTVNFTLGPWNYIIPNSVYGYEEIRGTFPVLWLPLTIWDNVGTYNFSITAFMTFPNGTTKQVPVITPNGYPADIQIFLNPWNNSYDYYVFTYQNAAKLNKSLGILVTRTTSYVDVGIPIGALLYSEVPVNITLEVTAFYNATASGTMGVSLYMSSTSVGGYYTSLSNYAYIADVDAGFDYLDVVSPLYLPNFTCYFNIVQQLFECYEGNYFVPVTFRGGLLTGNFLGIYGLYPLFIEYPYYFNRFGSAYYYVLYPSGSITWLFGNIGGLNSWVQTEPAYVSTAVGSRLVEAIGRYWRYPSVPVYQWQARYVLAGVRLFTNATVGTLFYGNYTMSDLNNRLTFNVTALEYSMALTKVSVGGYTFWANVVGMVGMNNVTLGNTLTSGYSLVVVLNASTLNIINTYKVPAGSNVTLSFAPGSYLVINMIPPQYNATEANILNLTQNPQYYPFAWSFDPTAKVYYVFDITPNTTTITLNATTYFLIITKMVLNTIGTDLTPLVDKLAAELGLPLFSVNGLVSRAPVAVLVLPSAKSMVRICIPSTIGPIVVVNSGCFNAAITANESLPLVIYVRLPVNLNITAINNNGKLVVKVTGTDFFGNPVVYYPINVTVYLNNGTATYTAVIRNGTAEVSTGLPYQGNTLITAQGNGTGAYLPASGAAYVPVTSVPTLPPWLAYVGSIWWLLLLVILLVVLIVVMMILERKRAKKRGVRAYTPYWV